MKKLRIKDICDKGSSNLKQKDVEGKNGLYPVYGASGIISHIDMYHQEENYIAIVKDGSGIGRVSFMPAKSSVIGTMQYILPKNGFNINYIGYCLQSLDLSKYKQGAAIPHIYFRDYGERFVNVTENVKEQQSIVDYLDSAFAKIDAMKANAEKALNEAKALFQASLKEMLEPKEGWVEKTLGEVCSSITDGTHHSPPNGKSGKYKYITAKNIRTWGLDLSNITYVSEDIHKEIIARCNPQKGDVLYIKDGATTGIAIVNPLEEEFSMLSSVALIKPHVDVLSSEFLCYSLNSPLIYNQMRKQMDGAAITRVTLIKIKNFVVSIPPLPKQQQIVSSLDSLKSKVDRLQENYDKISQECDSLKQALLKHVFNEE